MAMNAENEGSSTVSLPSSVGHSKRRATDKYWMILFLIAIIIWSVTGPEAARRNNSVDKINSDNSTLAKNTTSECIQPKPENSTITQFTSLYVSNVLGKNWLLDVFTCNPGFLDKNYNKSGLIVIWAHVSFSVCLLIYIFASMRSNEIYRQQFFTSTMILFTVSLFIKELSLIKYTIDNDITLNPSNFVLNVILWFISEAIFFMIGSAVDVPIKRDKPKRNDDDDVDHNNRNDDDRKTIHLSNYLSIPLALVSIIFYMTFIISLPLMFQSETELLYKMIWSREWSVNVIAIAAICYLVLVIYHFLLMTISCIISILYEKRGGCKLKDFVRALPIIARYHFGTACYQATVIFPRIHATFIMNEKEFRGNSKFSAIYRLYTTHWKIPNLSLTLTAACGYSYSESIRESLRLFSSDSPKLKKFQSFGQTHKCCSLLLIVIHSLILISLWAHGVTINPGFTTVIWLAYVLAICISSIIMRFYDAVADVLWYLDDGTVIISF